VTVQQNFDELGFAADHPGRAPSDSYYLNKTHMLRTHTSTHEIETFRKGHDRWLLAADVYRRDEIDRSHYPVFHQMEGAYVLPTRDIKAVMLNENAKMEVAQQEAMKEGRILIDDPTVAGITSNPWQTQHDEELARIVDKSLKLHLNRLVLGLFGAGQKLRGQTAPLQVRWIEAFFPFTTPSYEVEVLFDGKWLEILGCGVIQQATLERADVPHKMGWAFGLGLERIAMVLFSIPDIRLFWSQDDRFLSQFSAGRLSTFSPYSRYPPCYKDISFWTRPGFHENDFCDIVRNVAGDLIADVACVRLRLR
jgi:phenylalanyl-tRNA synthetase alpha chain